MFDNSTELNRTLTFSALEDEMTAGDSEFLHTFPLVLDAAVAG